MERSEFIRFIIDYKQIRLNTRWFVSNFVKSLENIVLRVVYFVGVEDLKGALIEIGIRKT